jgi:antirestriction protein ArdC
MLLALAQCDARELSPGPLATFKRWQALGRYVRQGEKALSLRVPITIPNHEETDATQDAVPRPRFFYRARWFVLDQTDGKPYEPVSLPSWNEEIALQTLGIKRIDFDDLNGNIQGYSVRRNVAINPVAALPAKTLLHELGHVILGHTQDDSTLPREVRELEAESVALLCSEALDLPGAAFARGYVQEWATSDDLTDDVAGRIMTAADTILRAGIPRT